MFGNKRLGTALMSLQEIGDRFGVSLQAIQAIEQRALRKIQAAIEREAHREGKTVAEWLYGD
jgi:DNA-directed RNA polymerase sigma subunit (sigma70/sigma32)